VRVHGGPTIPLRGVGDVPEIKQALGIAAAVLSFTTCPIYLLAIIRGRAKPDRVTWWVLAVVSALIASSYYAAGARETIWLPLEYVVNFLVVALFSIRYGEGPPRLHLLDRLCLGGAVASALVWWSFGSTALGLYSAIATECIGLVPTAVKAYARPWTEDRTAWMIATVASALNVLALRSHELALSAYPLYILVTNIVVTALILRSAFLGLMRRAERRA